MKTTLKRILLLTLAMVMVLAGAAFATESSELIRMQKIKKLCEGYNVVSVSDLDPDDSDFWIEVKDDRPRLALPVDNESNLNISKTSTRNLNSSIILEPLTTSNTKYNVYSSSGTIKYSNLNSVFDAIGKATSYGDYVRETDGTYKTVFRRNNSTSTNYKFQFTCFYDDENATNRTPEQWLNDFSYSHVYDGTGNAVGHSYQMIKDLYLPDNFALETNSGGYYYKFSYPGGYNAAYTHIDLSNTELKFSTTSDNNAYIFSSATNAEGSVEVGIMLGKNQGGNWVVYKKDFSSSETFKTYPNKIAVRGYNPNENDITTFAFDKEGYEEKGELGLISADEVDITIKLQGNSVVGVVTSDILSESLGTIDDLISNSIAEDTQTYLMQAVSFVPVPRETASGIHITPDLRNGAYLENVVLKNCTLNTEPDYSGITYAFYSDSLETKYSLIYNDDVATYTKNNATKETVNINYNLGFRY